MTTTGAAAPELAAVRCIQLSACARDLELTSLIERPRKQAALDELRAATEDWWAAIELTTATDRVIAAEDLGALAGAAEDVLADLASEFDQDQILVVALEAMVSTQWPKELNWVGGDQRQALVEACKRLDGLITREDLDNLAKRHKDTRKRLATESLSLRTQLTVGALMVAAAAATPAASAALATAVGAQLFGLSGAAATSAGMALFGGGSLAAGGFGMAGGAFVLGSAAFLGKGAAKQAVMGRLAALSAPAFVFELAKLDVVHELVPGRRMAIIDQLGALVKELEDEPTAEGDAGQAVGASLRALRAELRHLASGSWQRRFERIPRIMGVPALSPLPGRFWGSIRPRNGA